jgi:hypothetical protein
VFRAQADWTLILPSATSCESAAAPVEKNAAAAQRTEKLRGRLISLRNEHGVESGYFVLTAHLPISLSEDDATS